MLRAIRTEISFGDKNVDAYKLQNHSFEKRLGLVGVSESLGYSNEWLGRLHKSGSNQLKSMQREGYTGCIVPVKVPIIRGSSISKTISIRDFNKLLAYESLKKKNLDAIVLLVAAAEAGWERVLSDAFEGSDLSWFGEKIIHYSQWTYEELEEVLAYNREDVKALYPWGVPQDLNLHLNL